MGANAVFCTSGRKPRCSALTRRLVKRVALGLSDSASGCDIGVPTSVTVFSRSGAGPEALALTLLRIGLAIDRAPDPGELEGDRCESWEAERKILEAFLYLTNVPRNVLCGWALADKNVFSTCCALRHS